MYQQAERKVDERKSGREAEGKGEAEEEEGEEGDKVDEGESSWSPKSRKEGEGEKGEDEEEGEEGKDDGEGEGWEIDLVLDHRADTEGRGGHEYLIRWKPDEETGVTWDDSWEHESHFNATDCIDDYFRRKHKKQSDKELKRKRHTADTQHSDDERPQHKTSKGGTKRRAEDMDDAAADTPSAAAAEPRCDVCWELASESSPLLQCAGCGVHIHALCYLPAVAPPPSSLWRCYYCAESKEDAPEPECCMCPVLGGAVWPTADPPGLFAHACCALWVQELPPEVGRVIGLSELIEERLSQVCMFCAEGEEHGIAFNAPLHCASAQSGGCYRHFHLLCGRPAGAVTKQQEIPERIVRYVLCPVHRDEQIDDFQEEEAQVEETAPAAVAMEEEPVAVAAEVEREEKRAELTEEEEKREKMLQRLAHARERKKELQAQRAVAAAAAAAEEAEQAALRRSEKKKKQSAQEKEERKAKRERRKTRHEKHARKKQRQSTSEEEQSEEAEEEQPVSPVERLQQQPKQVERTRPPPVVEEKDGEQREASVKRRKKSRMASPSSSSSPASSTPSVSTAVAGSRAHPLPSSAAVNSQAGAPQPLRMGSIPRVGSGATSKPMHTHRTTLPLPPAVAPSAVSSSPAGGARWHSSTLATHSTPRPSTTALHASSLYSFPMDAAEAFAVQNFDSFMQLLHPHLVAFAASGRPGSVQPPPLPFPLLQLLDDALSVGGGVSETDLRARLCRTLVQREPINFRALTSSTLRALFPLRSAAFRVAHLRLCAQLLLALLIAFKEGEGYDPSPLALLRDAIRQMKTESAKHKAAAAAAEPASITTAQLPELHAWRRLHERSTELLDAWDSLDSTKHSAQHSVPSSTMTPATEDKSGEKSTAPPQSTVRSAVSSHAPGAHARLYYQQKSDVPRRSVSSALSAESIQDRAARFRKGDTTPIGMTKEKSEENTAAVPPSASAGSSLSSSASPATTPALPPPAGLVRKLSVLIPPSGAVAAEPAVARPPRVKKHLHVKWADEDKLYTIHIIDGRHSRARGDLVASSEKGEAAAWTDRERRQAMRKMAEEEEKQEERRQQGMIRAERRAGDADVEADVEADREVAAIAAAEADAAEDDAQAGSPRAPTPPLVADHSEQSISPPLDALMPAQDSPPPLEAASPVPSTGNALPTEPMPSAAWLPPATPESLLLQPKMAEPSPLTVLPTLPGLPVLPRDAALPFGHFPALNFAFHLRRAEQARGADTAPSLGEASTAAPLSSWKAVPKAAAPSPRSDARPAKQAAPSWLQRAGERRSSQRGDAGAEEMERARVQGSVEAREEALQREREEAMARERSEQRVEGKRERQRWVEKEREQRRERPQQPTDQPPSSSFPRERFTSRSHERSHERDRPSPRGRELSVERERNRPSPSSSFPSRSDFGERVLQEQRAMAEAIEGEKRRYRERERRTADVDRDRDRGGGLRRPADDEEERERRPRSGSRRSADERSDTLPSRAAQQHGQVRCHFFASGNCKRGLHCHYRHER